MSNPNSLKIAVLNWRDLEHPKSGGAETYALAVAKEFATRGHEVTYVTARHAGSSAKDRRDGYEIVRHGNAATVYLRTLLWLLARRNTFDAVLDCSNGIGFFSPLVLGRRTKVSYLVHHIHTEQWSQQFSAPVAAIGRLLEGPITRLIYRHARWIAVSESTAEGLRTRLKVPGQITIAHNGINQAPVGNPVQPSNGRVVFVGRPVVHKRLELLIDAVAKSNQLSLDVMGHGVEMPAIAARAEKLGAKVHFWGFASDQQRDEIISNAAVLAIPSDHEGWGLVVLEAAALGVPSVGFDVPGVKDSIRNNQTGWILDSRGAESELVASLTEALESAVVLAKNPVRRAEVAVECKRWAGQFTWAHTADVILNTWNK